MATLEELRERSDGLFTELLRAQAAEAPTDGWSWFSWQDAASAAALSFRLAALAASGDGVEDGLAVALAHAEELRPGARPEQLQIALALFVTHNREGRRLAKPRTVVAAPELFTPPRTDGTAPAISIGGASPGLDYWREDVLANEHHQHWHEVYPFTGIPPRDFAQWMGEHSVDEFIEILEALAPDQPWRDTVPAMPEAERARLFGIVLRPDVAPFLPRGLYRKLFRLNDRQGELFFFMHAQMLARYDAELLSHGLARVAPFGPGDWTGPIAAGHDPIEIEGFGRREPEVTLPGEEVARMQAAWDEIETALTDGVLRTLDGGTAPIDPDTLGEAVEPTVTQLRDLAEDAYLGLHGSGHVAIAALAASTQGVMASPVAAIRDPVFWQWHKAIDGLSARWQETLTPYGFDDAPPVLVRDGLAAGDATPWASPDLILCRTSDLPDGTDPGELGERLFGGAAWDTDFSAGEAEAEGQTLTTISELVTTMASVRFGGSDRFYLTHEPFSYFLRVESQAADPVDVTVRLFLAPAAEAHDRRMWMEMDKFIATLRPGRQVLYRPDTESSIIKRPAETSPAAVLRGGNDPDERSYCDCGWPYTLLLPRGDAGGMPYRLLALYTDASIDRVAPPEHCGSMSYCGAVDRYPDARDMGYPFCRPFAGEAETAIRDCFVALASAAARTVTILHA